MSDIKFTIDGKECTAKAGQTIMEAAKDNGVDIPYLCHHFKLHPAGACRVCTVKIAGKHMASCTTPVADGMVVESDTDEINEKRKAIIEMLFVEGNHYCPACEKSGNCRLQALGYKYLMMVPRFPYIFPDRELKAGKKIMHEANRCIKCTRCIRTVKADGDKNVFSLVDRSGKSNIIFDKKLEAELSDELADQAMENCPVGAILRKEIGFATPIGKRKYDNRPIGIE